MKTVGICGHFGGNKEFLDGQTVKTKIIYKELCKQLGDSNVSKLDSFNWKEHPFKLIIKTFFLVKENKNIIIMPAQNGLKIFVFVVYVLNKVYRNNLHYIVIGGWLPDLLKKSPIIVKMLKNFTGIYVETNSMVEALHKINLYNTFLLPNCKDLKILSYDDLIYQYSEPFSLCTFSRVMKEKGVEEAIAAVKSINKSQGRIVYTLDIYGQIDTEYADRFDKILATLPDYIKYKGCVPFNESTDILKNYYLLLFPTYYEGEGFAGTLIDAFAAGLPVVATNWRYNSEIVNKEVGFLYKLNHKLVLEDVLIDILKKNINDIHFLKKNCIDTAHNYSSENVIKKFITHLS